MQADAKQRYEQHLSGLEGAATAKPWQGRTPVGHQASDDVWIILDICLDLLHMLAQHVIG